MERPIKDRTALKRSCETLERIVEISAQDQERAARLVARSFYKILRQNGFTQNQIINVAEHLLDGLIRDMKGPGTDDLTEQAQPEIKAAVK
ncbi:MAG: hypothetical protein JSV26_06810 [bacterium]|nr:MAG: hypothetical protein JSV26_06810 [bacterium]